MRNESITVVRKLVRFLHDDDMSTTVNNEREEDIKINVDLERKTEESQKAIEERSELVKINEKLEKKVLKYEEPEEIKNDEKLV